MEPLVRLARLQPPPIARRVVMPTTPIRPGSTFRAPPSPQTPAGVYRGRKISQRADTQLPTPPPSPPPRPYPLTPPPTPPATLPYRPTPQKQAPTAHYTPSTPKAVYAPALQAPGLTPSRGARILIDAAGHPCLTERERRQLSPSQRNMHDHWFGRTDRNFSTHAAEFERLERPITSWQGYHNLAASVLAQKPGPHISTHQLANGKRATYDSARNLLVLSMPSDGQLVTMFRPGVDMNAARDQPRIFAPLAKGRSYVANLR